jgi:hypothetical protein
MLTSYQLWGARQFSVNAATWRGPVRCKEEGNPFTILGFSTIFSNDNKRSLFDSPNLRHPTALKARHWSVEQIA